MKVATTKALDWFRAKQRGERLPQHELPRKEKGK